MRLRLALIAAVLVAGLGAAPAGASAPATWTSRMAAAARYADARGGVVTFAVQDESGRLHGFHARTPAPSASVLKAMVLVAYLRRPDVRSRPLREWERALLAPMIRRSDNAAAPRMIGLVGERGLDRVAKVAGMEHFRLHWPAWGLSEVTPRGQALFFRQIDRLVPRRHRHYALRLLATVIPPQRWGVGRVGHGQWHLYFKGGWGSGTGLVDHQVALYSAAGERFSLALFTRFNPDHAYGKETLRGLAARLLHRTARPGKQISRVSRASFSARYVVTSGPGCRTIVFRPARGETRSYSTGAATCKGFRIVSTWARALWAWPSGNVERLRAIVYGDAAPTELGAFDSSDALGALAGGGGTLAYLHGGEATTLGAGDCPAPSGAILTAAQGRIALAAGSHIEVLDPITCDVQQSLSAGGTVAALALGDDTVLSLTRLQTGQLRLDRFGLSTGAVLGRRNVPQSTLPAVAVRGEWASYRTPHALRVVAVRSGRTWTVWRPSRAPVAAGFDGRRLVWLENRRSRARLWSLRLPRRPT